MAHINYTRQVETANRMPLSHLLPSNKTSGNFAVFCGSHNLRSNVAMQFLRQYVGKIGIIFIHNSPTIASDLQQLSRDNPNVHLYYTSSQLHSYDPLYGLSKERVIDAILPHQPNQLNYQTIITLRDRLRDYLDIIEYQYNQDNHIFGDFPYNLDILYQLIQMPYSVLEREVLDFLPTYMCAQKKTNLSAPSVQLDLGAAVRNFAAMAQVHLWTPTNAVQHTRLSITSAVKSRSIISIHVHNSNAQLLDYISLELDELDSLETPYLLVECGLDLASPNSSHKMASRFFNEHSTTNYRTGIITESPITVKAHDSDNIGNIFSSYREIVILSCTDTSAADLFTNEMNTYIRRAQTTDSNKSRRAFTILPTLTKGKQIHEVEEKNIRSDELARLGNGAIICGLNHSVPLIINNLIV